MNRCPAAREPQEGVPAVSDRDLPRFDDHPGAWLGPDMAAHPERWVWQLSARQIADIDATVARLDASGRELLALLAARPQPRRPSPALK